MAPAQARPRLAEAAHQAGPVGRQGGADPQRLPNRPAHNTMARSGQRRRGAQGPEPCRAPRRGQRRRLPRRPGYRHVRQLRQDAVPAQRKRAARPPREHVHQEGELRLHAGVVRARHQQVALHPRRPDPSPARQSRGQPGRGCGSQQGAAWVCGAPGGAIPDRPGRLVAVARRMASGYSQVQVRLQLVRCPAGLSG
jgi:hypothetical protein